MKTVKYNGSYECVVDQVGPWQPGEVKDLDDEELADQLGEPLFTHVIKPVKADEKVASEKVEHKPQESVSPPKEA